MSVRIHAASDADRADLLAFLDEHWRRGHVFVRRPDLLDWQHAEPGGGLNFLLATEGGALVAVLGYLPLRHFDPDLPECDVFLAIWKVRDDTAAPGLGIALLQALRRRLRPDLVGAIGLSAMVLPIYRALGFAVGRLDHHVLFADGRGGFAVASRVPARPAVRTGSAVLCPAGDVPDAVFAAARPRKSVAYLEARYTAHPDYRYRLDALEVGGQMRAVVAWRRVEARGSAVLRIVDLLGDDAVLAECGPAFQRLLAEQGAEYLDVYAHGLSTPALAAAGFVDRQAHPGLVVPNHFEPFEDRNVELDYAVRAPGPVRLLRGDADQDRPS